MPDVPPDATSGTDAGGQAGGQTTPEQMTGAGMPDAGAADSGEPEAESGTTASGTSGDAANRSERPSISSGAACEPPEEAPWTAAQPEVCEQPSDHSEQPARPGRDSAPAAEGQVSAATAASEPEEAPLISEQPVHDLQDEDLRSEHERLSGELSGEHSYPGRDADAARFAEVESEVRDRQLGGWARAQIESTHHVGTQVLRDEARNLGDRYDLKAAGAQSAGLTLGGWYRIAMEMERSHEVGAGAVRHEVDDARDSVVAGWRDQAGGARPEAIAARIKELDGRLAQGEYAGRLDDSLCRQVYHAELSARIHTEMRTWAGNRPTPELRQAAQQLETLRAANPESVEARLRVTAANQVLMERGAAETDAWSRQGRSAADVRQAMDAVRREAGPRGVASDPFLHGKLAGLELQLKYLQTPTSNPVGIAEIGGTVHAGTREQLARAELLHQFEHGELYTSDPVTAVVYGLTKDENLARMAGGLAMVAGGTALGRQSMQDVGRQVSGERWDQTVETRPRGPAEERPPLPERMDLRSERPAPARPPEGRPELPRGTSPNRVEPDDVRWGGPPARVEPWRPPPGIRESAGASPQGPRFDAATAQRPRAQVTSIRPTGGEAEVYKESLRRGEVGVERPQKVNVGGRGDSITARPLGERGDWEIVVTDAKTRSSEGGRIQTGAGTLKPDWMAQVADAVSPERLRLGDPELEARIRDAYTTGRVRVRVVTVDDTPGGQGRIIGLDPPVPPAPPRPR